MATAPRIALVLVWTGPWKPWINLYVESCRRNAGWDFLVFTDQPAPAASAPNVRFLPFSLADFAQRVRTVLDFPGAIAQGYKLCDYKPAYGLLFAEELRGYSHWGYCDEDIIWGCLDRFLPSTVLATHDLVTSCRCCIVGQLTILRNQPHPNTLFQRVPGWREILREPGTMNLAETILDTQARAEEARGELTVWRHQIQRADCGDQGWDIWADRLELAEHGRRHPPLPFGPALWRDGAVFDLRGRTEYAFFHFKTWKRSWPLPLVPPLPPGVAEWRIEPTGIRFTVAPSAPAATLAFVRDHDRATARLHRRRRVARLARLPLALWSALRHAATRRCKS